MVGVRQIYFNKDNAFETVTILKIISKVLESGFNAIF